MKYLAIIFFIGSSIAAKAQEDAKYKLNPDSLSLYSKRVRPNINGPLFILDEKQVSSEEMESLDPNKIESIQVLKDSASIAPYGEKGKNGVILIALKPRRKE